MGVMLFSESLLVPCSLLVTIGYHAYLCHSLRRNPGLTTIGINSIKRRSWLQQLNQGDDKKGMVAVQSLRNPLMGAILTGMVTIMITMCLGALINNTFNAFDHLRTILFITNTTTTTSTGLLSKIIAIKYGSAYIFLITSFLSSCMGISHLIDANFLVNAIGDFSAAECYTETILERGFRLVVVGNRVLCITFPLLLWMSGPIPMLISSLALVWALYQLDFPGAAGIMHT